MAGWWWGVMKRGRFHETASYTKYGHVLRPLICVTCPLCTPGSLAKSPALFPLLHARETADVTCDVTFDLTLLSSACGSASSVCCCCLHGIFPHLHHSSLFQQIHGDSLLTYPALLGPAERLQRKLRPVWLRLDDLLHNVRCMVDFVSNAQQL